MVLAITARLALLAVFPNIFLFEQTGSIHGSTAYDTYAQNLLATGVYGRVPGEPDALIPPLYSYVLAVVYGLFGRGGWQVGVFHTLLDALSIALLYEIGKRLFSGSARASRQRHTDAGGNAETTSMHSGRDISRPYSDHTGTQDAGHSTLHPYSKSLTASAGSPQPAALPETVGALAGLFYALYPYLIFQNLTLNDTALFMTLLHAFVLTMILLRQQAELTRTTWSMAIVGGLILGVTTLARALLPPLALFVAVWFLFRLNLRQTFLRLLPVALVSLVVVLPWMLRGYQLYGGFVAVALNSGENLFQGANDMTLPLFKAGYDVQWSIPPSGGEHITSPYERNAFLMQAGLTWLHDHPEKIPELLWVKFLVYWSIDIAPRKNPQPGEAFALDAAGNPVIVPDSGQPLQDISTIAAYSDGLFDRAGRPVHILYFGGLLLLALAGMGLSRRLWRAVSLLWFVQLSMTGMYLIFHPSTRYRVPTDPLLFLFSAYALVRLVVYFGHKGRAES